MRLARSVMALAAALLCVGAVRPAAWRWTLPPGASAPPVPAANPMSAAKVELGRRLFYDADLSADGTMACATCHEQRHAFADGNRTHPGVHGDAGRRNVPGLANVAWMSPLTWADPRQITLEAQLLVPVTGDAPIEMGMKGQEGEIVRRLAADPCYRHMFAAAFPERAGAIDMTAVAMAVASFERALVSYRAPIDAHRAGRADALSPPARQGAALFARDCARCHAGADFSDGAFHPGVGGGDPGLAEVTHESGDTGLMRTPSLRNVALTAPYFHDGSAATIDAVLDRHGGVAPADRPAVKAFLAALTDDGFVRDPRFALPERACGRRL